TRTTTSQTQCHVLKPSVKIANSSSHHSSTDLHLFSTTPPTATTTSSPSPQPPHLGLKYSPATYRMFAAYGSIIMASCPKHPPRPTLLATAQTPAILRLFETIIAWGQESPRSYFYGASCSP
ncbi:hypothetical protein GBA52_008637, partial [Prunus armeniaca]